MNEEISETIPVMNVGDCFYYQNGTEYKHHIVAIVEDGENVMVVHKYYGKHKQWWHYEIEYVYGFNHAIKIGLYTKERRKK